MNFWANLIGYQIVWFCAVIGAGHGLWWPGVIAAAIFIPLHFAFTAQHRQGRATDFGLVLIALLIGAALDGAIATSGLGRYAANGMVLPVGGAPLWILSLWASFALTLRHSMTFLLGRPWLACIFGALGGPLAYLGASRGWQAITFAEPRWMALVVLSIGWGLAIPLLTMLASRWSMMTTDPVRTAPEMANQSDP
jgi:Protein of unknown function (DUF2878)